MEEPSFTFFMRSFPTPSTSVTPALSRIRGPSVGYRPVIEGLALITARTPRATTASAATRSRSSWSITAISPGWIRATSRFVRASTRATASSRPGLTRRVASLNATPHLEVHVGEGAPNVSIDLRLERERADPSKHGQRSHDPIAALQRHPPEVDHHHPPPRIGGGGDGHPDIGIPAVQTIPLHVPNRAGDRSQHGGPWRKDHVD